MKKYNTQEIVDYNPRGRANKKFKGECCLKKYNTLEIVG